MQNLVIYSGKTGSVDLMAKQAVLAGFAGHALPFVRNDNEETGFIYEGVYYVYRPDVE